MYTLYGFYCNDKIFSYASIFLAFYQYKDFYCYHINLNIHSKHKSLNLLAVVTNSIHSPKLLDKLSPNFRSILHTQTFPSSCWRYIILFNCILMDKLWFVTYLHTLGEKANPCFHSLGVTSKPIPSRSRCEGMTQTKPEAFDRISMDILVFLHERIYKGGMKSIRYN